ncbi:MmpS family transport accessory protein [Saccharothrix variisporea]|uniref:MmpS family membrane protein n=1 Tax=Saccharothrix variisporea TaxID=543527 RepID=A0A495XCT6_9PSEU|nr:MmpS family transport accessory protein [Saccharothrix variisporea]RKT72070.1 MmpS family membrane protein [Saccharothrix variisporea]
MAHAQHPTRPRRRWTVLVVVVAVGLLAGSAWLALFPDEPEPLDDLDRHAAGESTVVYEITGDAKTADVRYSTYSDGDSATEQERAAVLPWSKVVKAKGVLSAGTLTAMAGADGGTVTCRITVDGVERKTASATGPFALADCNSNG